MHITWDEILEGFNSQVQFTAGYSPLYHALYSILTDWVTADTSAARAFRAHTEAAWAERPLSGWLEASLLTPAAIHAAVLAGDPAADSLRGLYGTVGGEFTSPDALQDALGAFFSQGGEIMPWFLRHGRVQTNEITRSVGWLIPAAVFSAWQPGLQITLVDLGCSAGLNLSADWQSWAWNLHGTRYTLNDPPALIEQTLHIEDPNDPGLPALFGGERLPRPTIYQRVGFDRNPLDVYDDDHLLMLQACIWGDQPERLRRFEGAVAGNQRMMAAGTHPRLYSGDIIEAAALLPRLLPAQLPTPHLLLVFNSAVTAYFNDADYDRLRGNIIQALASLPDGAVGLWLENETPRYNEQVERPKHFLLRARTALFGGVSSFYLGELEAHPSNLYIRSGWGMLRDAWGW